MARGQADFHSQSLAQWQYLDNLYRRRRCLAAAMFVSEPVGDDATIIGGRTGCRRFLAGKRDPWLWMVAPFDSAPLSLKVNRARGTAILIESPVTEWLFERSADGNETGGSPEV